MKKFFCKIGFIRSIIERNAVAKMGKELLPELQALKTELVLYKEMLAPLGNYKDKLVRNEMTPTDLPIRAIIQFFTVMSKAYKKVLEFNQTFDCNDLPKEVRMIYDKLTTGYIFKGGVSNSYSMNRTPDDCPVSAKYIFLGGDHVGVWTKDVAWILERWSAEWMAAREYSCHAWGFITSYFEAINLIEQLEKELESKK